MKDTISFQKLLWALFAFIALMILVRFIYTGKHGFIFLIWNLFLAWIPFTISTQFKKLHQKNLWQQTAVFFVWLLFFPNALYIVTDLIHLDLETTVPKWFDALLLFASAVTGLMMAFISLLHVEKYLLFSFNKIKVHSLMLAILFLGSFGLYLGRFLRWNSWDIVNHPFGLAYAVAQRCVFPLRYAQTWGITSMFTLFFYLLYWCIKKIPTIY